MEDLAPIETKQPAYELHVQGFQSLHNLRIQFSGYTAIVGPTDSGKSAVFRALRAVLFNVMHPSWITEGREECTIKLTCFQHPNIHSMELHRNVKKDINKYTIVLKDGRVEEHPKTGKTTPQVMQDNGIRMLETDRGQRLNLNMHTQHEPSGFILSKTETEITDIYNALFGTNRIEGALLAVNKDIMNANREFNELSGKEAIIQSQLDNAKNEAELVSAQAKQLASIRGQYEVAENRRKDGVVYLTHLREAITAIGSINANIVQTRTRLTHVDQMLDALRKYSKAVQGRTIQADAAQTLNTLRQNIDLTISSKQANERLDNSIRLFARAQQSLNRLTSLEAPVAPDRVDEKTAAIVTAHSSLTKVYNTMLRRLGIDRIEAPVKPTVDPGAAAAAIDQISQSIRNIGSTLYYQSNWGQIKGQYDNCEMTLSTLSKDRQTIEDYEAGPLTDATTACGMCGRRVPKLNLTGQTDAAKA